MEAAVTEQAIDAEAVEEAEERSDALVRMTPRAITERARGMFDEGQMELIHHTVAKDCNDAELAMFLEICARYELDPFAKQIWAIKYRQRMTIFASRDGLLAIANRNPDFEGVEGDVICENDSFQKIHTPEGLQVTHEVTEVGEKRGKVLGAWAAVRRAGRVPTYFLAEWSQYKGRDDTPWGKQPHAMILKVAESNALRKAFSISGLIGEDEMRPQLSLTRAGAAATPDIEWPDDEQLTTDLKQAFDNLGYTHAKRRLKVNGKSEDDLRALLDALHAEADAAVQDAEVVNE